MLLNWRPILVGLPLVLDLTCKAPESIGAFVHSMMRKFHFMPLIILLPPTHIRHFSVLLQPSFGSRQRTYTRL